VWISTPNGRPRRSARRSPRSSPSASPLLSRHGASFTSAAALRSCHCRKSSHDPPVREVRAVASTPCRPDAVHGVLLLLQRADHRAERGDHGAVAVPLQSSRPQGGKRQESIMTEQMRRELEIAVTVAKAQGLDYGAATPEQQASSHKIARIVLPGVNRLVNNAEIDARQEMHEQAVATHKTASRKAYDEGFEGGQKNDYNNRWEPSWDLDSLMG